MVKIKYKESITLEIEEYINKGLINRNRKKELISYLNSQVKTWCHGFHASSFAKQGKSLCEYLDFKITKYLDNIVYKDYKHQEELRKIWNYNHENNKVTSIEKLMI